SEDLAGRRAAAACRCRSGPRTPAQEIALQPLDREIDAENDGRGEDEAGEDAGRVEDAFRLRHDVADAARRAEILADDGAGEREADRGMEAGEDPGHHRRQI